MIILLHFLVLALAIQLTRVILRDREARRQERIRRLRAEINLHAMPLELFELTRKR